MKSLYVQNRVKYKVPKTCLLSLYYSIIYPHLSYSVVMWGSASKSLITKLILLQKRALRITDKAAYLSHTYPIFKKYRVLKFSDIYMFSCVLFVYRYKSNFLPNVCNSLLSQTYENSLIYNLRTVNVFCSSLLSH